ncbi:CoA pyrophosphatase [Roseivirga sp. E12]|uniref:NUDIX hydrolase n=1 Tax=Roseivirga sp. E12 TaxID=2819237 RepID=UPI001ABC1D3F
MILNSFDQFVDSLAKRLTEPLPGRSAQETMAPRPISERRFQEDPNNPARPGGVMVLLYPKNGDIYIPLTKRPVYTGAHSGQVSLPGGKVEQTDRDIVHTALRETQEEIGVANESIEVIGQLSELFIIASNFKVFPTVGVLRSPPNLIPDAREVTRVLTPSIRELRDLSRRSTKTMHFPPYTIESPYFDVEGEVVWGATAMILSELVHVIEEFY